MTTDVSSSHLILDVQGNVLAGINKNQDMWQRLLEQPPSNFRDTALEHIKEYSRADDLVFSFLKDAMSTVIEKMEFSSSERDKIFASRN
ncbi:hypothetical protein Hanom_Chr13g01207531 [Helianthus anomalus]